MYKYILILDQLIVIKMTNILSGTLLGDPNMTKEKGAAAITVAQELTPAYRRKMLWRWIGPALSTGSRRKQGIERAIKRLHPPY